MLSKWTVLETHEFDETMMGSETPDGDLWCRTPCNVPVATPRGWGAMQALIQLHAMGMFATVKAALQRDGMIRCMEASCLADFLVGYDEFDRLAMLLEDCPAACEYVLALPASASVDVGQLIDKGKHLARATRAQRSATEALQGIDLYEKSMVAEGLARLKAGLPE